MVEQLKYIWLDGELVPWESAKIHVLTHGLHYGLGVFEGIRCYETSTGKGAFFRLEEHIRRLFDSAKVVGLTIPYNFDQVTTACVDIVKENDRQDAYVRPIAFSGLSSFAACRNRSSRPCRYSVLTSAILCSKS